MIDVRDRVVTARFRAAGYRLYLVGGSVRDLLAGADTSTVDYDFTTDARPEAIAEAG